MPYYVAAAIVAFLFLLLDGILRDRGERKCEREGHETLYGPWHCVRCGIDLF